MSAKAPIEKSVVLVDFTEPDGGGYRIVLEKGENGWGLKMRIYKPKGMKDHMWEKKILQTTKGLQDLVTVRRVFDDDRDYS